METNDSYYIVNCDPYNITPRSDDSNSETCIICIKSLDNKYTLSCNHSFHEECIKQWKKYNKSCPVCRCSTGNNNPIDDSSLNEQENQNITRKFRCCILILMIFIIISLIVIIGIITYFVF